MLSTHAQSVVQLFEADAADAVQPSEEAPLGSIGAASLACTFVATRKLSVLMEMATSFHELSDHDSLFQSSAGPLVELAAVAIDILSSSRVSKLEQQEELSTATMIAVAARLSYLLVQVQLAMHNVALALTHAEARCRPQGSSASHSTRKHDAPQQQQQRQQQIQRQQLVTSCQQLLLSPEWRRVSSYLLVAHCYALLRSEQHPATTGAGDIGATPGVIGSGADSTCSRIARSSVTSSNSSSSSSGGGSSSSSLGAEDSEDAATSARRLAVTQAHNHAAAFAADWQDELHALHMQLLRLLGCSSKGILWAAGLLAAQQRGNVLCTLAEARASTRWWAQQGNAEGCAEAPSKAVATSRGAAEDALLSTVLLHCAAHAAPKGASHPQCDGYVRLCECAAVLAESAWGEFTSVNLPRASGSLAAPSQQLQAASCAAQQLAAAEGEQVFFLQHILTELAQILRGHADTVVTAARLLEATTFSLLHACLRPQQVATAAVAALGAPLPWVEMQDAPRAAAAPLPATAAAVAAATA